MKISEWVSRCPLRTRDPAATLSTAKQISRIVLGELQELRGVAKNPAVIQQIDALMPMIRDHLARTHALAVERGYEKKRG